MKKGNKIKFIVSYLYTTYLLSLESSYTKFVVTNYVGHILRVNKE